jgi:hypothetical protein
MSMKHDYPMVMYGIIPHGIVYSLVFINGGNIPHMTFHVWLQGVMGCKPNHRPSLTSHFFMVAIIHKIIAPGRFVAGFTTLIMIIPFTLG